MSDAPEHPLLCHPASRRPAAAAIGASARLASDGSLILRYNVRAPAHTLLLPAARPPGTADGLWRHTCCEAFVTTVDGPEYHEFNLSPAGEWAVYRFTAYRERDPVFQPPAAPRIACVAAAGGFCLSARIAGELLPPAAAYAVGLSAVIETPAGELSYWALAHAAGTPDFHHRQGFTLTLEHP